jgi:hypothetical protein
MQTTAQLIENLQAADPSGVLPARILAAGPDGVVHSYDIAGAALGPADYGQQVNVSVAEG